MVVVQKPNSALLEIQLHTIVFQNIDTEDSQDRPANESRNPAAIISAHIRAARPQQNTSEIKLRRRKERPFMCDAKIPERFGGIGRPQFWRQGRVESRLC